MKEDNLTSWGEAFSGSLPLPEYPRPQFQRQSWQNLNGQWDFEITSGPAPDSYSGHIIVPFSPESVLSGADRCPKQGETAWYRRPLVFPKGFLKHRLLLHFGAVDTECHVYVNNMEVGQHSGAYDPFTIDITDFISLDWNNTLSVSVTDSCEGGKYTYGKQSSTPGGIWYHGQSGIWQTVWMESVPKDYIESVRITPFPEEGRVVLEIPNAAGIRYAVMDQRGIRIASGVMDDSDAVDINLPDFRLWSPEDPYLYDLYLNRGDDVVKSYFAMRSVRRSGGKLLLNGVPLRAAGVLDQGYWPDGLYTAPADGAMIADIQLAKDMGFNLIRKHMKVEPLRWYYHCDRLGMLVIQDIPNGGDEYPKLWTRDLPLLFGLQLPDRFPKLFGRTSLPSRDCFRREMLAITAALRNCPSVIAWTIFNEGWGQFQTEMLTKQLRKQDRSRLIDSASGWHDQGCGDFCSRHYYFRRLRVKQDKRINAITECGGFGLGRPGESRFFAYRKARNRRALASMLEKFYCNELLPLRKSGVALFVYTQLTDVENEKNGLLTADRKTYKVDPAMLSRLNSLWKTDDERSHHA